MQARSIGWEMVIAMARKKGPDSSSQASEPPLPDPGGNMLVSEPRRSNRYWRRSKGVLLRRMRKTRSTFGRRVAIGRHPDKARFTGGLALQEFDVPPTGSKQSTSRSTVRVESGNIVTVKGKCNKIWL